MFFKLFHLALLLSEALLSYGAVHEKLAAVPRGWTAVSVVPNDNTPILLQIGLVQQNIDQLEAKLKDVSTPGKSAYGKHLSKEEVDALFAPSAKSDKKVQDWLRRAGVKSVSSDGHYVTFQTTVSKANLLLEAEFKSYTSGSDTVIRTTQYSIPDDLKAYIDLVLPTTYFGKLKAAGQAPPDPSKTKRFKIPRNRSLLASACTSALTPQCVKELYNIGNYTPDASSGSKIGFGAFIKQSARYDDLDKFEQTYKIPTQNFSVELVNGGINQQNTSNCCLGEANLDLQIVLGVAHPLPITEYIVGGLDPGIPTLDESGSIIPFLPYYQYLLSRPNGQLPQVITDSYGDEEEAVPKLYAIRTCNTAGLLGLRGVSILVASGDFGVSLSCKSNDGLNTTRFLSIFPSSCPYITAVGGTQGLSPEIAWGPTDGIGGSSGGFSEYFSRPWYQTTAVNNYLANHISSATKKYYDPYVNFKGRAFPDVAAHAYGPGHLTVNRGLLTDYGTGASAASPMVAAIIALLNDARLKVGKSSLGFLNPLIYSFGNAAFTDIVSGGSTGCTGFDPYANKTNPAFGVVPYASWNATLGWDPVTGFGTPDFQKLKALVLSL